MKRALWILVLTIGCASPKPPAVDEATLGAVRQLTEAVAQQPTNMPWIYVLATYQDRARNTAEVARWLGRLDELGWEQGANPIDFRNTGGTRAFRAIKAKLDQREPRVNNARAVFTIPGQRELVPEGIAYDPVDDVFYLTSIYQRKVVRVDRRGNATDFVAEARDGMLGGLGTKVDADRRLLWVISTGLPEMRNATPVDEKRSMLAAYDLRDGRLVKKIEATPAMLNDLTLLADGSLFATDMGRHKVVRLAAGGDVLEDWAEDFRYPNGIAVSDDQRFLYVADFRGVSRITIADKSRKLLETGKHLNGIDGLTFHKGKLIAIQNAIGKPRVLRIDPETLSAEILESKNDRFELPLTGAVAGDAYYFIANPGLRSFGDDHKIWPLDKLEDPLMLRIALE